MKAYAGIDLHSSNNYLGIINDNDKRLYGRRIPNDLNRVLMALEPFKDQLEGIVVESTYCQHYLYKKTRTDCRCDLLSEKHQNKGRLHYG